MSTELNPAMRRSVLISMLRDPKLRPEGFTWDYGSCAHCAIGLLARTIMPGAELVSLTDGVVERDESGAIATTLGLTATEVRSVFWDINRQDRQSVTPAMVADRLESIHRKLTQ